MRAMCQCVNVSNASILLGMKGECRQSCGRVSELQPLAAAAGLTPGHVHYLEVLAWPGLAPAWPSGPADRHGWAKRTKPNVAYCIPLGMLFKVQCPSDSLPTPRQMPSSSSLVPLRCGVFLGVALPPPPPPPPPPDEVFANFVDPSPPAAPPRLVGAAAAAAPAAPAASSVPIGGFFSAL